MAEMQRNQIGGVKELVVLVGILLTVIAGAIGTYWIQSQGVEAASTTTGPRAAIPTPPAGVFHADVYFDFKSTRLRADAARVLQETASRMDLTNAWVVLVQGYTDNQGPTEYNRGLAERRAVVVACGFGRAHGFPFSAARSGRGAGTGRSTRCRRSASRAR